MILVRQARSGSLVRSPRPGQVKNEQSMVPSDNSTKFGWRSSQGVSMSVFGFDQDGPEVFQRTLDFLLDAHVEIAQITPLTPFPGTPLFDHLRQENRILTTDWRYYDLFHVVFQPHRMSPQELQAGTDWVVEQFYGLKSLSCRTAAALRCHGLRRTIYPILPLNLAARHRIRTWELRPSRRTPHLHWLPD